MSVVRKNLHFGKRKAYSILTTDRIVLEHHIFKHCAANPDTVYRHVFYFYVK